MRQMKYIFSFDSGPTGAYLVETDQIQIGLATISSCIDTEDGLINWITRTISHEHVHRALDLEVDSESSIRYDDLCIELEERDLHNVWMRDYLGGERY